MAKTMYNVNPYFYNRSGGRRPGATCDRVYPNIPENDVSKRDRDNRKIVTKKMIEYVENGMDVEKAATILANNVKVKKAFHYLIKAGIDLKELFIEFYNKEKNKKNRDSFFSR